MKRQDRDKIAGELVRVAKDLVAKNSPLQILSNKIVKRYWPSKKFVINVDDNLVTIWLKGVEHDKISRGQLYYDTELIKREEKQMLDASRKIEVLSKKYFNIEDSTHSIQNNKGYVFFVSDDFLDVNVKQLKGGK